MSGDRVLLTFGIWKSKVLGLLSELHETAEEDEKKVIRIIMKDLERAITPDMLYYFYRDVLTIRKEYPEIFNELAKVLPTNEEFISWFE